ncbi:phosphate signaling complex protein PhoU [Cuneatibacter sp. NSJ-177]|uniref:phosphate signaling complex protein PhoU n=1 Tax=Cuneatibacter sp. NSJ-177 TaxID=2931401 RepID=UPI001FD12A91|nr:phosphate signaling complex protein PhoU [Cuneatibacter sp. NSJ-177]MCJ7836258.1 phosphate signaling complex protein PhoU [Cuneatibacter sp. NSJ-177]
MRNRFDRQLEELHTELIQMGALCERAIRKAVAAVMESDAAKAKEALEAAGETDRMEREAENLCLKLLLHQQPVARDLRQVSAALKMITDMERIGNQAADISEIVMERDLCSYAKTVDMAGMAETAIEMVTRSVDSYVKQDLELAKWVIREDDVVDDAFVSMKSRLVQQLVGDGAECALDLLMVAKYLEKIGDHAVNIAEWVEFSITGIHRRGEKPEEESEPIGNSKS